MGNTSKRELSRKRRQNSVRKTVKGTPSRPRICVFRSLKYTYAQLVDDVSGAVMATVTSKGLGDGSTKSVDSAKKVGQRIAEIAKENKVEKVVFDRNGYLYHGRVAAVAEGAREGGLSL